LKVGDRVYGSVAAGLGWCVVIAVTPTTEGKYIAILDRGNDSKSRYLVCFVQPESAYEKCDDIYGVNTTSRYFTSSLIAAAMEYAILTVGDHKETEDGIDNNKGDNK